MKVITNDELKTLKIDLRGDDHPADLPWTDDEIYAAVDALRLIDPTATMTELTRLLILTQHYERQAWIDARKGRDMTRDEFVLIHAWMEDQRNEQQLNVD